MHSLSRALLATATLFLSVTGIAAAQTTPLSRQMSRIDFGISGVGQLTGTVTGPIVPSGAANAGVNRPRFARIVVFLVLSSPFEQSRNAQSRNEQSRDQQSRREQ